MAQALSAQEIAAAVGELDGWEHEDGKLVRRFRFGSFKEALSFLVRVGLHAEELNHHPEIWNVYDRVTLSLCTHDAGDQVTGKDVELARAVNAFEWTR